MGLGPWSFPFTAADTQDLPPALHVDRQRQRPGLERGERFCVLDPQRALLQRMLGPEPPADVGGRGARAAPLNPEPSSLLPRPSPLVPRPCRRKALSPPRCARRADRTRTRSTEAELRRGGFPSWVAGDTTRQTRPGSEVYRIGPVFDIMTRSPVGLACVATASARNGRVGSAVLFHPSAGSTRRPMESWSKSRRHGMPN